MRRIIAGPRAVLEALGSRGAGAISVVYLDASGPRSGAEIEEAARTRRVPTEKRAREELDALAGGLRHQGVLAISGEYGYRSLEELLDEAPLPALFIALDEITDPHNFGAIVRTAVALGADGVITLKKRAAPVTPTVVRVSAGATEHARIARVVNLSRAIDQLAERGLQVVGLDAEGALRLEELPPAPSGRVLVVGSEGRGLRRLVREHCEFLARIDLPGPIRSLNASVAAGIAIHMAAQLRSAVD